MYFLSFFTEFLPRFRVFFRPLGKEWNRRYLITCATLMKFVLFRKTMATLLIVASNKQNDAMLVSKILNQWGKNKYKSIRQR